jgi:hypothetical protein
MNCYIKVINGQTVDHPVLMDNLFSVFGSIPEQYQPFYRIQQPANLLPSPFYKAQNTYVLGQDGVTWQDSWTAVEMTSDEQATLIAETQANPPGPNLTLNTTNLQWIPNTTKPDDGNKYYWNFQSGEWVVVPSANTANT